MHKLLFQKGPSCNKKDDRAPAPKANEDKGRETGDPDAARKAKQDEEDKKMFEEYKGETEMDSILSICGKKKEK